VGSKRRRKRNYRTFERKYPVVQEEKKKKLDKGGKKRPKSKAFKSASSASLRKKKEKREMRCLTAGFWEEKRGEGREDLCYRDFIGEDFAKRGRKGKGRSRTLIATGGGKKKGTVCCISRRGGFHLIFKQQNGKKGKGRRVSSSDWAKTKGVETVNLEVKIHGRKGRGGDFFQADAVWD